MATRDAITTQPTADGTPAALSVLVLGEVAEVEVIEPRLRAGAGPHRLALATADLREGPDRARASTPHVALVCLDGDMARALTAVQRLSWEAPSATLVALTADRRSETVLRAMRAGATEVLHLPLDEPTVAEALDKLAAVRALADATAPRGTVWTVVAPKEGIGATTMLANLGLALRTTHGRDVVLVDLDFRNADLALLLNVDPAQSLDDLAAGFERLDPVFLHGLLTRHASGLLLLAAAATRGRTATSVSAAHTRVVLEHLRASHPLVIVDAPPPLSDAVLAAAAEADRVLLPTEATVPCLRAAWRTVEVLQAHGIAADAIDVVVTRHVASDARLTLEEIAEALGRPVRHVLPREDETACLALNSGLSIAEVRADGPLQRAIAALAQSMIETTTDHAPGLGLTVGH
jgi:pilus assembly protein CpaE